MGGTPTLTRVESDGIFYYTDAALRERSGIVVAFSERAGGVSVAPYATLDLAAHTGDDPDCVAANRARFLEAVGLAALAARTTTAEQVHGSAVIEVAGDLVGAGARPGDTEHPPLPGVDALLTREQDVPLVLFFADCVPVVLVSESSRAVAVAHAGWRGALAGVCSKTAGALRSVCGDPQDLVAYVGPHIGVCCYEVGPAVVSQFDAMFATIPRASGRLDLAAAVAEDLDRAGIPKERQCHLGICTAHNTDRFYSYRAEGRTGRHAALAVVLSS